MTNIELVNDYRSLYKAENPEKDIDTYKGWKDRGFQVQKGEKSVAFLDGRGTAKDYSKSKRGRRYFYDKKIHLFSSDQVRDENGNAWAIDSETAAAVDQELIDSFIA